MSSERSDLTGGCLCGAVRYTAGAETLGNAACHCGMCRSWSGHVWASVMVPKDALKVTGAPKWFRSSGDAERGFCATCGTSLFWRADGADGVRVAAVARQTLREAEDFARRYGFAPGGFVANPPAGVYPGAPRF